MTFLICVMYRTSLALTLFLILLNFKVVSGLWRYENILDHEELYTIGHMIQLKFLPDHENITFYEWYTTATGCHILDIYSPVTQMTCLEQGYHMVMPYSSNPNGEEHREIYISKSPMTFVWYAVIPEERNYGMTKVMRMWIIDPHYADISEILNTATIPSRQSYFLSRNFYNLGQFPRVKLPSSKNKIFGKFTEHGYWEAELDWNKTYLTAEIDGQSISFQHRIVLDSSHKFYWEPGESFYDYTAVPVKLESHMPSSLISDPCHPHRSVFMSPNIILITSDGYRSYMDMRLYFSSWTPPLWGFQEIANAILLEDGIILQIADGLFWRSHQTRELEMRPELLLYGVIGITQRATCLDDHPQKEWVDFGKVLVWTTDSLYIGGDRIASRRATGTYFQMLTSFMDHNILTASFASDPNLVAMFVVDIYGVMNLYMYNHLNGYFDRSSFLSKMHPDFIPRGTIHMRFFESSRETLFLWNATMAWYSFYDDTIAGMLTIYGMTDLSIVAQYSTIHEVILDKNWNLLIKMRNNLLFFCKFGMFDLVPMHSWILETPASLYLDDEKIKFISVNPVARAIEVISYPLQLEKLSAMKDTYHDCPYVTFAHSMNKHSYYMDKGQEEIFWAEVIYPEGKGVYVKMQKNSLALLDFSLSSDVEFVHKVFTVNVTIKVKQTKDYTKNYREQMILSQGVQRVEIYPSILGNRCDLPKDRVSYFNVGCPPNRHIRMNVPLDTECEMYTFHNYTIPGSKLRNPQADDKVVVYDWNSGCVLKMHYKSVFKPELHLFDGDEFVKAVDANFVVWEIHGRHDYSFNTTMRQAGCLRESQTWSSLMQENPSLSINELWTPETYVTCFILEAGLAGDLTKPYEVLNISSSNHLTFSQEDSAVYVFALRVVDPNYSFCDLVATFAIQTYGISKSKYGHLIPYVSISFAFLTLCILGYSYYRYMHIFRELQMKKKCD